MDRVVVASPCSGHGFKHSAAIGEVLARMVMGEPHLDVSKFGFRA
jgi:sarcosine oxidase